MHLFSQGGIKEGSERRAGYLGTQTDVDKIAVGSVFAKYPGCTETWCRAAGVLSSQCNRLPPLLHGSTV